MKKAKIITETARGASPHPDRRYQKTDKIKNERNRTRRGQGRGKLSKKKLSIHSD